MECVRKVLRVASRNRLELVTGVYADFRSARANILDTSSLKLRWHALGTHYSQNMNTVQSIVTPLAYASVVDVPQRSVRHCEHRRLRA